MPDTTIKKTPQGWIDVARPNAFHQVRRLAREARRKALGGKPNPIPHTGQMTTTQATTVTYQPGPGQANATVTLTGLDQRLYDRLTQSQGVSDAEALEVICDPQNGYNKAASYGHMREAGANHWEAKIVIALDSPDTSLAYGRARAQQKSHTDALAEALKS